MFKLFSIQEANDLIPTLDGFMNGLQDSVHDVLRLRDELTKLDPMTVAAQNKAQEIGFLLRIIHETKAELDQLGVFLKDVDAGMVDVPCQIGAEVVYLTWEKGQSAITHYHRLNELTKQPLPGLEILKPAVTLQAAA